MVALTNLNFIDTSLDTEAYTIYACGFYGCTVLTFPLHPSYPRLGGYNGDVQTDIVTLDFKN